MNTNRSNVTENAFANIDNEKYSQNFDHIFNREKCKCEECEKEKCEDCGLKKEEKDSPSCYSCGDKTYGEKEDGE